MWEALVEGTYFLCSTTVGYSHTHVVVCKRCGVLGAVCRSECDAAFDPHGSCTEHNTCIAVPLFPPILSLLSQDEASSRVHVLRPHILFSHFGVVVGPAPVLRLYRLCLASSA